jgi:signal transduction histidine kinase/FixJ family two-component response regulator
MAAILVVDDRASNRDLLAALLTYAGHTVSQAADGAQGLEATRAGRPDLVIADLLMPTMDGYEFVRRLRADPEIAATPVVFYTATYQDSEARALAEKCGVRYMLSKPMDPEAMLRTVEEVLGLARVAPPPAAGCNPEIEHDHRRLLTDTLSLKVEELEAVNERLTRLVELGRSLVLVSDPRQLLGSSVQAGREMLCARHAVLGVRAADGQSFSELYTSAHEPGATGPPGPFSPADPILARILHDGRPLRETLDRAAGARLTCFAADPRVDCYLGVPVSSPANRYGFLLFAGKVEGTQFSTQDEGLASILAAQLAVGYENALRRERLRTVSRQLLRAQEEERRHIARELHDEIGQSLTAAKISLQRAMDQADKDAASGFLQDSLVLIEGLLQQVRNLSLDLRPSVLDDLGLAAALRWYIDRLSQRTGIAGRLAAQPANLRLAPETETTCFRVAQEALTNVVRHARAQHVQVSLVQEDDALKLVVRDDGVGFDVAEARSRAVGGGSLGLLGMQERLELIGGRVVIEAGPDRGTEVQAWLPLSLPVHAAAADAPTRPLR